MDQHHHKTVAGRVTDVFAHRFVIETAAGRILADLGPKGAAAVALRAGAEVEITGEAKPSEIKVRRIVLDGRSVEIEHDESHGDRDDKAVRDSLTAKGFRLVGEPRLKPKHAEVLCRDTSGRLFDIHVDYDGTLRKSRAVAEDDPRRAADLAA